ncbi:uncharacterized protein CC84DRAFT_1259051 [Paraphaeosphaeria sporulosa]|uniref:F-box domain-containing protein n=1 Tax=Paraphaeosphaeria sporulosa TaxID=1460663 RepID=A0A177CEM5_9PLEO|nr:uncharacterized protein CC84DRAFT_1259051 [Paraphaeosphaeria sporulosa]OAG05651.1 hypothetical protein CC84DRAFT_1259051 [Paraphaeosphaeria sporulosa]
MRTETMTYLEALPNELLARIVSFSDRRSLAQLRLTNKRLEDIAVVKLFERVTLYAHWAKQSDEESEDRSARDYQSPVLDKSNDHYGDDREDYVPRRDSVERLGSEMQKDEEDGFIAGSDEDEEYGLVPTPDLHDQGRRDLDQRSGQARKDDDDGFLACPDMDDDLSTAGDNSLSVRPRFRGGSSLQDRDSASEASDRPPRPDPFSVGLPDFRLYEKQRHQKWEAARPQWARDNFPGPSDYDAAVFLNIVENERLRNFVKEVRVYTCETHCDHHPKTGEQLFPESWPEPNFHPHYVSSIQGLGEFPNVCGLNVHFDRHAAYGDSDDFFQGPEFQHLWLEKITKAAKESISHLAVRHFANPQLPEGKRMDVPRFMRQVAKASSLRLSVKHAETHPGAGTTYRDGHVHPFWESFPALFLLPASTTLTALVLYSDIPLGWFPKLDLRAVHLPNLASLTLGHHILHHNHQVDWIVSHGETLRELIFDRCSILYQIGCNTLGWLDDDGYPKNDPTTDFDGWGWSADPEDDGDEEFGRNLLFKSNDLRWGTVFSRLASSLPRLHEFRFGTSSQWDFDTTTVHFRSGATTHMPIMPWEDEHNLNNSLFEERYVIWDDWQNEYRSKWMKTLHGRDEFGVDWRDEWLELAEEYPQCERDDLEALQALLETIKGR